MRHKCVRVIHLGVNVPGTGIASHRVGTWLEIPDGTVPRTSLINRILMGSSLVAECCIFERRNGWKNSSPQMTFWKDPVVYVGQRRCWNDNEQEQQPQPVAGRESGQFWLSGSSTNTRDFHRASDSSEQELHTALV